VGLPYPSGVHQLYLLWAHQVPRRLRAVGEGLDLPIDSKL
jgi:hypothetical protein